MNTPFLYSFVYTCNCNISGQNHPNLTGDSTRF